MLVESGVDWVKEKYPTVYKEYASQSVNYVDPFTGNSLEIDISSKGTKRSSSEKSGGLSNV